MSDPVQPLREEIRNLEAFLQTAQTRLAEHAGGLGIDVVKGAAEVVLSIGGGGGTAFPSTEDASHDVLQAIRCTAEARAVAGRLAQAGVVAPGHVEPTLAILAAELDRFPVNENLSHSKFSDWVDKIAALRGQILAVAQTL